MEAVISAVLLILTGDMTMASAPPDPKPAPSPTDPQPDTGGIPFDPPHPPTKPSGQ